MEVVGIAASTIQVPGAGLALAQVLYSYCDAVSSSRSRIRDIVFYIRHKALVIQEIGDVFRDEVTSAWYRGELLKQRLLLWKNVRGV